MAYMGRYRKRRYIRRRARYTRPRRKIPRPIKSRVYYMTRSAQLSDYSPSTTVPVDTALIFTLDQLPSYTEFTALFDEYYINKVQVKFIARNITSVTSPYSLVAAMLHTAIDYDDATAPGSITALQQYSTYRFTIATKSMTRTFRPKVSIAMYKTSANNAYGSSDKKLWVDCAYTDVEHYGLKFYMPVVAQSQAAFTYSVFVKYWISFRNTK